MVGHSSTNTNAKILRLNTAGFPIEWVTWQDAVCLHARELVVWTLGAVVREVKGGWCRLNGKQSKLALSAIIACGGSRLARPKNNPKLSNSALFARDKHRCMYCGHNHEDTMLTRDHILPMSRGGSDDWENVVAACRRCNQFKSNRRPEEVGMQLVAAPFIPSHAEFLALINHQGISEDQIDFLKTRFPRNSRLHDI